MTRKLCRNVLAGMVTLWLAIPAAPAVAPAHEARPESPAGPTAAELEAMSTDELHALAERELLGDRGREGDAELGMAAIATAALRSNRSSIRLLAKAIAMTDVPLGDRTRRLLPMLRAEAMRGSASSVFAVALLSERGDGMPVNEEVAFEWYRWAAVVGLQNGRRRTAMAYATGLGTLPSDEMALSWLERMPDGEAAKAARDIGEVLMRSDGDRERAATYFDLAVSLDPKTGAGIAEIVVDSAEQESDFALASEYVARAADAGHHTAGLQHAETLVGKGTSAALAEAAEVYRRMILAGSEQAALAASRLLTTSVVGSEHASSLLDALQVSAESGNVAAMLVLGQVHLFGAGRTGRSLSTAADYFGKAARRGNPEAQYQIGMMYANAIGVEGDLEAARQWLAEAAENGHPLAANTLDRMRRQSLPNAAE